MKKQSQRRTVSGAFILAVMAALVWVPSACAQRFSREVAQAQLSPAIHSAFDRTRPSLPEFEALPFSLQANYGSSDPQLRFLVSGERALSLSFSSRLASDGPAYATVRMRLAGTDPGHGMGFAPAPVPGVPAIERQPVFYQEDTPFSTQVRKPVAHVLGGRLRLDAFYREISANNMVRGAAQATQFWRPIPGGVALRSAKSYGVTLTFAFLDIRKKER